MNCGMKVGCAAQADNEEGMKGMGWGMRWLGGTSLSLASAAVPPPRNDYRSISRNLPLHVLLDVTFVPSLSVSTNSP